MRSPAAAGSGHCVARSAAGTAPAARLPESDQNGGVDARRSRGGCRRPLDTPPVLVYLADMSFVLRASVGAALILAGGLVVACNGTLDDRPIRPASADASSDANARDGGSDAGDARSNDAAASSDVVTAGYDAASAQADGSYAEYLCPTDVPTCKAPSRNFERMQPILAQCTGCHPNMGDRGNVQQSRGNMMAALRICSWMKPHTLEEWDMLVNWLACGAPQDEMPAAGADSGADAPTDGAPQGLTDSAIGALADRAIDALATSDADSSLDANSSVGIDGSDSDHDAGSVDATVSGAEPDGAEGGGDY